jgi:hypothetical protein
MTTSTETSPATPGLARRTPDFFLVGHPKCGTTALYEMLRRHPQVFMPDLKEPWFFAEDLRVRAAAGSGLPETLEQYLSLFEGARPEQQIGEATPSYLRSRGAAARIARVSPQARIVAILREPASFLHSFHLQSVQARVETEKDLRRALELERLRRGGEAIPRDCARPEALMYSDHVRYVEQLRRFQAAFGREQMLILVYDDFRSDNEATVRRVLRFLDVDDTRPVEVLDANPSVRLRSSRLEALVRVLYLGEGSTARAAKAALSAVTPKRLRRDALQATQRHLVYGRPRPLDATLALELRRRFRGEVVALSEYLDRDLVSEWGYADLD